MEGNVVAQLQSEDQAILRGFPARCQLRSQIAGFVKGNQRIEHHVVDVAVLIARGGGGGVEGCELVRFGDRQRTAAHRVLLQAPGPSGSAQDQDEKQRQQFFHGDPPFSFLLFGNVYDLSTVTITISLWPFLTIYSILIFIDCSETVSDRSKKTARIFSCGFKWFTTRGFPDPVLQRNNRYRPWDGYR